MSASDAETSPSAFALGQRLYNTVSYAGAALVMLVLADFDKRGVAPIALLWVFHFVRRSFESLLIHRFSGRLVPPADYLVEYLYYWGFATWVALGISSAEYEPVSPLLFNGGLLIFVIGELGNAWAHLKLRTLRSESGVKTRAIPSGGPFELVSCPHYSFEIISWIGFALLCSTWGAWTFLTLATGILAAYAKSRHDDYRKTFDGKEGRALYPPQRKALIPFVF